MLILVGLRRRVTCKNDVGDVSVAGVVELLRVLQAAVAAGQPHHRGLRVVEGGTRAVQAVGTDGVLDHVELFELETKAQRHYVTSDRQETRPNNLQSSRPGSRVERDRQTNSSLGFVHQNMVYFHGTLRKSLLPNFRVRENEERVDVKIKLLLLIS